MNRTLLAALVALIPFCLFAGERIISSDPQSITFEYIPTFGNVDTTVEGGLRFHLDSGDLVKLPGRPLLPVRFITIATPPGSKPSVRLVKLDAGSATPGKLATYQSDGEATPQISTLVEGAEPVGKFESRTIAGVSTIRIPIYPVRESYNGISVAKSMQIRVDFNTPPNSARLASSRTLSTLQKAVILNSDQAAKWGGARTDEFIQAGWPQGYLYRFNISDEALYKLTYEALRSGGVPIEAAGVPSNQIKLFGNGGLEMPNNPDSTVAVGLLECAIFMEDGRDGIFGPGDWILFYGKGPGGYVPAFDSIYDSGTRIGPPNPFEYKIHHYDTKNTYWLNIDPAGGGKRMSGFMADMLPTRTFESAPTQIHLEPERFIFGGEIFAGAGRQWYGYSFDGPSRVSYTVSTPGLDTAYSGKLSLRIVQGSGTNSFINVKANNVSLTSYDPANDNAFAVRQIPLSKSNLRVGYNTFLFEQLSGGTSRAMFDWLEMYYYSKLDHPQIFQSAVTGSPTKYTCSGFGQPMFFDITAHNNVKVEESPSIIIESSNGRRRFLLADKQTIRTFEPHFEAYFPPNDDVADILQRSTRYDAILITPDGYYDVMKPLVDLYSRRSPSMRAVRVRLSEIYNRFGGGVSDITAIRNFLKFTSYNGEFTPAYVVFCGDGDYDYRNISRPELPNMMPPWESGLENGSMASDDWYVDFTTGGHDLIPEIATGRLTAQTPQEMETIIAKIVAYEEEPEFGLWRNRITMVADDEVSETSSVEYEHVLFTEDLANRVIPPTFDFAKIYETEYQRQWGREKPAAADALVASINAGTVIVNYMGHGNPTLWSHEHVFVQSRDMGRLEPTRQLPLFIAFTCDWAYYDDPASQSFPEQLLALPNAGGIGAIASTRLTYSGSNFNIARNFFADMFGREYMTPGEALALAKHQAWGSVSPTYHLLGDPGMHLAAPKRRGRIVSLNPQPLVPLRSARVAVSVLLDTLGNVDPTFTGEAQFILFDTHTPKQYYGLTDTINYILPGATVARGFMSIVAGQFGGDFTVPRDVTFNGQFGKSIAYFYNDNEDGVAALDSIVYAGRAAEIIDTLPPTITLFFDNRAYRSGDPVSSEPLIIADLVDSSGINLTGAMGHGIWVTVDGGRPIDLTQNFRYNLDSRYKGSLEKRISELEAGHHVIRVEAWDACNNLGVLEQGIDVVDAGGSLLIDRVLNLPNPFNSTTALTFRINRPADYEIRIFTVNGREIRRFTGTATHAGLISSTIWNGYDDYGRRAGNGVYLYKVTATDSDGDKAEGLGRIAFIR